MPAPTPYDRQNSFTLIAQENPAEPYTGAQLDAEFNAIKVTADEIIARLGLIQRDDGQLGNNSVGPDQFAISFELGINPPTAWVTTTAYTRFSTVFVGASLYRATEDHTSGTFETDLAAGKWVLLADFLEDFDPLVLNDGDVTTAKIDDGAVTTQKIALSAVNAARLASNAVETAKIADLAVTTGKLADGAVEAAKLAANSVQTAKLVDEAVTLAKIQTIATAKFLGRETSGTGAVELLDMTAAGRALMAAANLAAQQAILLPPRISTAASSATPTPNADTTDQFHLTALAAAATFAAPTGTPVSGQKLLVRIKDNGSARALSWNAAYRAGADVALPISTTAGKTLYLGFIWNAADSKWDLIGRAEGY